LKRNWIASAVFAPISALIAGLTGFAVGAAVNAKRLFVTSIVPETPDTDPKANWDRAVAFVAVAAVALSIAVAPGALDVKAVNCTPAEPEVGKERASTAREPKLQVREAVVGVPLRD
jgi:hypothetical protein